MSFTAIPALTLPAGSSSEVTALRDAAEVLRVAHNAYIQTGASDLEKLQSEVEARKSIATFLARSRFRLGSPRPRRARDHGP